MIPWRSCGPPPERELCATLGVGCRTFSGALAALEADGLIWRRQGKGTFIGLPPEPTQVLAEEIVGQTRIIEVMEARLCIEPALAAMWVHLTTLADNIRRNPGI